MGEENNKSQNGKQPRRFNQQQYDLLKHCSDKKDMTEWNKWRKENPKEDIFLEGADFEADHLEKANLHMAHMRGAYLGDAQLGHTGLIGAHLEVARCHRASFKNARLCNAHIEGANFNDAKLEGADLGEANLEGADLDRADLAGANLGGAILKDAALCFTNLRGVTLDATNLEGAKFGWAIVDGETLLRKCKIGQRTDFHGVGLDSMRIEAGTKQLLEYNIRRMNWEEWYKEHPRLKWLVKPFWWVSNYGVSTGRIIITFFVLAIAFAGIYYVWGMIAPPGIVDYLFADGNGVKVAWWLVPIRAIHFSVVIMTVGFTNMHANAHSMWAHILVSLQMILGFVLLGALVTRFAVLFTAGGPAGKFTDENKKEDADNGNDEVS